MPPQKKEEVRDGQAGGHDQVGCPAYPHRQGQGRKQEVQGPQARPGMKIISNLCASELVTSH